MSKSWHRPYADFRGGLAGTDDPFFMGLSSGSMSVELFEPEGADTQTPHAQDELYIVRQGTARFTKDGEEIDVGTGDVIFVEAGVEHRFVTFSEDFSVWVVFWGPTGGEGGADADRRDQAV